MVCGFSDWNFLYYLDVVEMVMVIVIVIDWVGKDLFKFIVEMVKKVLVEKGIKLSYNKKGNMGWVNGINNWN